jgi:multiple sugar transport system ATP-binding protein
MATIKLRQVEKRFGDFQAVKPMDLAIPDGEFVVLLGPSGCGKTTTLRMISGLETVSGGSIYLNDRNVTWLHPSARDIAFVFQLFALYPHMTARQNIVFPLQAQKMSQEVIDQRFEDVVNLLRINRILDVRPGKLSGGDRQRVALARALVRRPAAFLMDEPLGALDAEFRESMRAEIKQLHIDQQATTVYVTHDQVEAMAMGDRIVVMSNAEIQQVGTPEEVYYSPANLFVARFIGSPGMNLLGGHLANGDIILPGEENRHSVGERWRGPLYDALGSDEDLIIGFRPEAAHISDEGGLVGKVYASDLHGAYTMLHVNMNGDDIIHIRSDRRHLIPIGTEVRFDLDIDMVRFFHPKTENAIIPEVVQ